MILDYYQLSINNTKLTNTDSVFKRNDFYMYEKHLGPLYFLLQ
jgi:hypothetical protein